MNSQTRLAFILTGVVGLATGLFLVRTALFPEPEVTPVPTSSPAAVASAVPVIQVTPAATVKPTPTPVPKATPTPSPKLTPTPQTDSKAIMENFSKLMQTEGDPGKIRSFIDTNIQKVTKTEAGTMVKGMLTVQKNALPGRTARYQNEVWQKSLIEVFGQSGEVKIAERTRIADTNVRSGVDADVSDGYRLIRSNSKIVPAVDYSIYRKYDAYVPADVAASTKGE